MVCTNPFPQRTLMRCFTIGCLWVFSLLFATPLHASETVTVGTMTVKVPDGWVRADADGRTVLVPKDLPQGVTCSLTFLGGEAFKGSVIDRLAEDWKQLASG